MKYFVLLSGISGSGKSTIEKNLVSRIINGKRILKLEQVTTRNPRSKDEIFSGGYVFVTKPFYDKLYENDMLMAASNVMGKKYGTLTDYHKDNQIYTVVVNALGYHNIVKHLKENKEIVGEHKIIHFNISSNMSSTRNGRDLNQEQLDLDAIDHKEIDLFSEIKHVIPENTKANLEYRRLNGRDKIESPAIGNIISKLESIVLTDE